MALSSRVVYLGPSLVLGSWGGVFLYLAVSGRLRVLLHPLFWPVEEGGAGLLLLLAAGYLFFFRALPGVIAAGMTWRVWARWGVLVIPLLVAVIFAPDSLSARALERRAALSGGRILAQAGTGAARAADHVELVDLAAAAYYPEHIPEMSGRKVRYLGQYFPGTAAGEFRFCRVLMSCCASDATPIYLHVVGTAPAVEEMQWITIEGETFFRKDAGEWTPCVRLTGVSKSAAPPDPYLYAVRMNTGP